VNTGSRRKGSLTLWKLTPPNLIPNARLELDEQQKTFAYSLLARIQTPNALERKNTPAGLRVRAGKHLSGWA
jgi:hypothetical protein